MSRQARRLTNIIYYLGLCNSKIELSIEQNQMNKKSGYFEDDVGRLAGHSVENLGRSLETSWVSDCFPILKLLWNKFSFTIFYALDLGRLLGVSIHKPQIEFLVLHATTQTTSCAPQGPQVLGSLSSMPSLTFGIEFPGWLAEYYWECFLDSLNTAQEALRTKSKLNITQMVYLPSLDSHFSLPLIRTYLVPSHSSGAYLSVVSWSGSYTTYR